MTKLKEKKKIKNELETLYYVFLRSILQISIFERFMILIFVRVLRLCLKLFAFLQQG